METLSELLKRYMEKSGHTVYSLSYLSKVNRTTLHRAITGERPISRENLDRLLPYLNLTPNEEKELESLFYRNRIGEYNYQKYIYIKDLLENIELEYAGVDFAESPITAYSFHPAEEARLLNGTFAIIQYIYQATIFNIKNEEEPYIHSLSPFHSRFFLDLYRQFQSPLFQKLRIRHLIPFIKTTQIDSEASLSNLQMLSSLLPVALSDLVDCDFFYYYEKASLSALTGVPFTYYILNNCNVLLLSSDFQKALILPSCHLSSYRQHFVSIADTASPLLDSTNMTEITDIISIYSTSFLKSDFSYLIEAQPCVIQFLDNAMISKYINKELPEEQQHMLIDSLNKYCRNLRTLSKSKNTSVFCREGYYDFVNNGRIRKIPDYLYHPLGVEERIVLLKRLIQSNEHGNHRLYMMKKNFRPKLDFVSHDNSSLAFYFYTEDEKFRVCTLREPNIIASLNEFVKNFCESELVYSIEETNDIIRDTIRDLENGLSVG